jgi:hypothetical protein
MPDTSASFERVASWLDGLRTVVVSLFVAIAFGAFFVVVIREAHTDVIAFDPVLIQVANARDAPKPELAAQQIANYINLVQRAGLSKWRNFYTDQSPEHIDLQAPNPIDLQIPGAPFSLRSGVRAIAELLGVRHSTIQVTIVSRKDPDGYIASIALANDLNVQTCQVDQGAVEPMERLFECIAVNVVTLTDPKFAVAYVFQGEQKRCGQLDANEALDAGLLAKEQRRIKNRRDRCGFEATHRLITGVVERGRPDDLGWLPLISGKVHLARAKALAGIDWPQQLGEFDQAIGRFGHAANSVAAPTALIDAYVQKGISIHEATSQLQWTDDPTSVLQWRLRLAESTFADAFERLRSIRLSRSDTNLRALVQRLGNL